MASPNAPDDAPRSSLQPILKELCDAIEGCAGVPAALRVLRDAPALPEGWFEEDDGRVGLRLALEHTGWSAEIVFRERTDLRLTPDRRVPVEAMMPLVKRVLSAEIETRRLQHQVSMLHSDNATLLRRTRLDHMTGLLNGTSFHRTAHRLVERVERPRHVALLLIDVDDFKVVNDTFGHAFGDRYIRLMARTLRGTCRAGDPVGRIGGDEFAVLLCDIPEDEALVARTVRRIQTSFMTATHAMEPRCRGAASIGAHFFAAPGPAYADVFRLTDAALYREKAMKNSRSVPRAM